MEDNTLIVRMMITQTLRHEVHPGGHHEVHREDQLPGLDMDLIEWLAPVPCK
jgi:hypothetical protein